MHQIMALVLPIIAKDEAIFIIEEFHSSLNERWGVAKEALENGILLYGVNASDKTRLREWFSTLIEPCSETKSSVS